MKIKNLPNYIFLVLGIKENELLGFRLLTKLGKYLVPSYRFTWPELDWFRNSNISDVLIKFDEGDGFNAHRRLAIQQLLRLTANVAGDTAECGVYRGCGSYLILQSHAKSHFERTHHIFDSFEGLSIPIEMDGKYWSAHDLSISQNIVDQNLATFRNYKLYKGWIPTRFSDVEDLTFSFIHVDVDLYQPTFDSISFFYDRLNHGGIFICDDYGFLTCPGATAAIDEFLLTKPEKMILLPGGGGFFIKGCETASE